MAVIPLPTWVCSHLSTLDVLVLMHEQSVKSLLQRHIQITTQAIVMILITTLVKEKRLAMEATISFNPEALSQNHSPRRTSRDIGL